MANTTNTNVNVNTQNTCDDEVYFVIVRHIGVLEEYQTGWKKELNLVKWNGNDAVYDIRDWSPDHERMSRGITIKDGEVIDNLTKALANEYIRKVVNK